MVLLPQSAHDVLRSKGFRARRTCLIAARASEVWCVTASRSMGDAEGGGMQRLVLLPQDTKAPRLAVQIRSAVLGLCEETRRW